MATAFALSLPLFGLAETIASPPAFAAPDDPCVAVNSVLPATKSAREATAAKAAAQWFPADQVAMATAVAGAESTWNATAVNKAAGGNYGLWQINSVHDRLLDARTWSDPQDNAWMAYQVWDAADGNKGDGRGSWKPWSVYNSGSYKSLPAGDQDRRAMTRQTASRLPRRPVSVATWNVLKSNSKGRITEGVRRWPAPPTCSVCRRWVAAPTGRRVTGPRPAGFTMTTDRTAVPLFYRTDKYTAVEQGRSARSRAAQKIERRSGKGTERTLGKSVTWLQLRDNATQETFYVVNTHLIVGAYNGVKAKNNDRRIALYKQQIGALTNRSTASRPRGSAGVRDRRLQRRLRHRRHTDHRPWPTTA